MQVHALRVLSIELKMELMLLSLTFMDLYFLSFICLLLICGVIYIYRKEKQGVKSGQNQRGRFHEDQI